MDLEHASNSLAFVRDARTTLAVQIDNERESLQAITTLLRRIEQTLKYTPRQYTPPEWDVMTAGLRVLANQLSCLVIAQNGDGDLLTERAKAEILTGKLRGLLTQDSLALPDHVDPIRRLLLESDECDLTALRKLLSLIPLPTLYWYEGESTVPHLETRNGRGAAPSPMLRVIVFLDDTPIASPQMLSPNVLYSMIFKVRGLIWPEAASRLRIQLLTTCPPSEFSVSTFVMEKPQCTESGEYEADLPGNIRFNSGQSSLLSDLVFAVHAAFETSDEDFTEIPLIGHNELRLRVFSGSGNSLMAGTHPMDRHLFELLTELNLEYPKIVGEMPALLEMLRVLTRLHAAYAQEAIFKGRNDVSEREFNETVLRDLRVHLGPDVEAHPAQGGGVTDIRYRGVIVELKVERENGDRAHISKKYTRQAVQYASADARQVSVLLVLDLTAKVRPPSDIRNDILLTDVITHGGDGASKKFPSKAFILVINGNTTDPSAYS